MKEIKKKCLTVCILVCALLLAGMAAGSDFGYTESRTTYADSQDSYQELLNIENAVATVSRDYIHTGDPIIPADDLTVILDGQTLSPEQDYQIVGSSDNVSAGKGSIEIQGVGDYTGSLQCTFTILPAKAGIKYLNTVKKNGKAKMTVKMLCPPEGCGADTYKIRYRIKGSSKWKMTTCATQKKVIKKLNPKKNYQVQVRAFTVIDGVTYAGEWSKAATSKMWSKVWVIN